MHAGRGRSTKISAEELGRAVDALEKSVVDGMCIFTFSQLLEIRQTDEGRKMVDRVARFRRS